MSFKDDHRASSNQKVEDDTWPKRFYDRYFYFFQTKTNSRTGGLITATPVDAKRSGQNQEGKEPQQSSRDAGQK